MSVGKDCSGVGVSPETNRENVFDPEDKITDRVVKPAFQEGLSCTPASVILTESAEIHFNKPSAHNT